MFQILRVWAPTHLKGDYNILCSQGQIVLPTVQNDG